ncbi:MAG: ABC transporter permease, partial [Acidobacteria bacterium]|nr:ABC transporter permease [Acidobacteriota bacterium]
ERDLRVRGARGADARVEATRALGNELSARARARDEWIAPWIQDVMQDVRFAARLLMRDRAFATTVVVVLGLGIGVNNIFFTVAYAHTLRGLPIDRAERVVHISTLDDRGTDRPLSLSTFAELQRSGLRFTAIAAFHNAPLILGDERRAPDRVDGAYVSARAFGLLGVKSILGRSFTADDDRAGAPMVVMLGNAAWQSRYGGESAVVGRSILVNGLPASVIGIVPDRSGFPSTAGAWLPLAHVAETTANAPTVQVFGRVRDEVDLVDARSEIEAIIERALQPPATAALIVRTTADARVTEAVLRGELLALDAGLPLYRLATMAAVIDEAEWGVRMSVVLVHILTLLALGLSGVGLYAVTAYAVGQRTQEIGLRVALSARSQQVRRLIFGRALAQMALGLGLGILGALGWDRAFADGQPDVSVSDPASLVMVAAVLVAVMCVACFVPARRATRLDPIVALRHE